MSTCQQCSFFWSGGAHVEYALIGILAITLLFLAGILRPWWLLLILIFAAGSFVDIWVNNYQH